MNLREIGLILRGGGSTCPDGISKVKGCQTGHHCVKVDDTNGLPCLIINQHIAHFRIVMGNPQGEASLLQKIHQKGAILFPLRSKLHFRPNLGKSPCHVLLCCFQKLTKPFRRVVKVDNGFMKGVCGIIAQKTLKFSESPSGFSEHFGVFHCFVGGSMIHISHATPKFSLIIHK